MTGLIVRKDLAPDVKSICDLFDPKYKGKVDMLTEMRDTVPLVMKCQGVDLAKATEQDWLNAIDKIKEAADAGRSGASPATTTPATSRAATPSR